MRRLMLSVCTGLIALAVAAGAPVAVSAAPRPDAGPSAARALPADVNDFSFDSFAAEYHLDLDESGHATMRVVETIVARFPGFDQNRGIIRAIPLTDGEFPLDVTLLSVTDEHGDPVFVERSDYGGFAEFALGTDEFVHGRQTYVLEYTLRNTIRHFEDTGGDEFYWDVNGTGWAQEFGTVSAHVYLSDALAAALTGLSACYQGYYGSTEGCELEQSDGGRRFDVSTGPIGPYSTVTIAIGFEGGTVVQPALARDSWVVTVVPSVLAGLAGLLVIVAGAIRAFFWRDHRGRGTIIAEYDVLDEVDVLLAAEVIGRRPQGLPALFVDFAVRGMVQILVDPSEPETSKNRFTLRYLTDDGASAPEQAVLAILFGTKRHEGDTANPGRLGSAKGDSLYRITAKTAKRATSGGLRAKPGEVLPRAIRRAGGWVFLAFVPVWAWAIWNDVLGAGTVVGFTFLTAALAVAVPVILIRPNLLTESGAAIRDHLLGMKLYLTVAEEERMRVLQSAEGAERIDVSDTAAIVRLYERLLPYAVLWGVEDSWVRQLAARYEQAPPTWIEGAGLDAGLFRGFTMASTSSVRPIVTSSSSGGSSWSSSGGSSFSSGSSGGGFSGGGGGGGGGGGR